MLFGLLCFHKWNKPETTNPLQQDCSICGKVRMIECTHVWKEKGEYAIYKAGTKNIIGTSTVNKCTICGIQKINTLYFL